MLAESVFRPYNIRGIYPAEFDEEGAAQVARAFAKVTGAKKIAVGRDARLSGPSLLKAIVDALVAFGVDVYDLGMVTTDQLYFAAGQKNWDGLQVSASHNPSEWNGLKFIKKGVVPLTDAELAAVYDQAKKTISVAPGANGKIFSWDLLKEYIDFLVKSINQTAIKPFKVVINPLNGAAGPVAAALAERLRLSIVALNVEPDGSFPLGNPDPFLREMRRGTSLAVKDNGADLGVSWDNDADRAAFFDETGEFVPGVFITTLLSQELLKRNPGAKIISDPRVIWPVAEAVKGAGGIHVVSRPGHGFIKARMRQEQALFAGELSGHYFFKDFWYADNGFLPWLWVLKIMSESGRKLSELVQPFRERYFFSEEMSFPVDQATTETLLNEAAARYKDGAQDHISGLSVSFTDWRFNLRPSDNEPKIRFTVETRKQELVDQKQKELSDLIRPFLD